MSDHEDEEWYRTEYDPKPPKFLLISTACAECASPADGPLVEAKLFDTLEEAKANSWIKNREWHLHPQGGHYISSGQGDDWVLQVPWNFVLRKDKEFV